MINYLNGWPLRVGLSLLSGVAYVLLYPNFNNGWLAWVALCPLIVACTAVRPLFAYILGLITGIVANYGYFYWIFKVNAFEYTHGLLLSIYLAQYFAVWALCVNYLNKKPFAIFGLAVIWVVLDYLKANTGFLAFPWPTLAQSQHNHLPFLQLVSFVGELGLSWLIVFVNLSIAYAIKTRNMTRYAWMAIVVVVSCYIYGGVSLKNQKSDGSISVAIVQPSIPIQQSTNKLSSAERFKRLQQLTYSVATKKLDLIVWPETALRNYENDQMLKKEVKSLVRLLNTPLLTGASLTEKFSAEENADFGRRNYNSAYLISPDDNKIIRYDKIKLVPFAETIPLGDQITWPSWILESSFQITPGDHSVLFGLSENINFKVLICWENLFQDLVRSAVSEQTNFLVHISNLNWFGKTAAAKQHNMVSVIRAVENGVAVISASNTGPSQVIGPHGRIIKKLKQTFTAGALVTDVPVSRKTTFFRIAGHHFATINILTLGFYIVFIVGLRFTERQKYNI